MIAISVVFSSERLRGLVDVATIHQQYYHNDGNSDHNNTHTSQ